MTRQQAMAAIVDWMQTQPPLFPRDIADTFNLDSKYVRNLLRELIDKGLVQREYKPDAYGHIYMIKQGSFDFG